MGLRYSRSSSTIVREEKHRPRKTLRYGRGFVTADVVIIEVHCTDNIMMSPICYQIAHNPLARYRINMGMSCTL